MRKSFTWFFSLTLLLGLWCIASVSSAAGLTISSDDVELVTDLSTVCDGEDLVYQVNNYTPGDYEFAFNYNPADPAGGGFKENNQFTTPEGSSFTVTVKDTVSGEISNTISYSAADIKPLVLEDPDYQDALCNGSTGEITINWSGGKGPYLYYVYTGSDTIAAAAAYPTDVTQKATWQIGEPAGTYCVAVNNGARCLDLSDPTNWRKVTIDEPDAIVASASVTSAITCNGDSATVEVSVTSGGTPDGDGEYMVTLDGVTETTSGQVASFKVPAGTYTAEVEDANGCSKTLADIEVTEPDAITFDITIDDTSCGGATDGAITVSNEAGGNGPYEYSIDGGDTWTMNNIFSGLEPTYYSLWVRDTEGCTVAYQNPNGTGNVIAVQSPADLSFKATSTAPTCYGEDGNITVVAKRGDVVATDVLYSFDNKSSWVSTASMDLAPGTYQVFVKNATGSNECPVSQTITVDPTTAVTATFENIKSPTCPGGNDGHFKVVATGGNGTYSYSVDGSNYYTNAVIYEKAGTHTVQVKDMNGCTSEVYDVMIDPLDANIISATTTDIACYGNNTGRIIPSVDSWAGTGRTVKFWYSMNEADVYTNNTPLTSATELTAGTYYVGATDEYGCSFDADKDGTPDVLTIEVKQAAELNLTAALVTENATCFDDPDGIISLTASGGTDFGDGVHAQYWLSTSNIDVSMVDPADFSDFDAYDSETDISTATVQMLKGTYYVYVRDNDCTVKKWANPITIQGYDPVVIDDSDPTIVDVLCKGSSTGAITLPAATGGSGDANLTYTLQMNGLGWADVDGEIDMSSPSFINLGAGDYRVIVADSEGCAGDTTVTIPVAEPDDVLSFTVTGTDITCYGANNGIAKIEVTGGTAPYKFQIAGQPWQWMTSDMKNVVITAPGTYMISVMDTVGCKTDVQSVTIDEPEAVSMMLMADYSATACPGDAAGSIEVKLDGGHGFYWVSVDDGDSWGYASPGDSTYTFSGLKAGEYTVLAKDAPTNGCVASATTTIEQPDTIYYEAVVATDVLCKGASTGEISVTGIKGGVAGYTVGLSGDATDSKTAVDGEATFTGLAAGDYTITVTDANSCTSFTQDLTVTEPDDALTLNVSNVANIGCTTKGQFEITATGGTTPYKYYWALSDPDTGHVLTEDMPGEGTVWSDNNMPEVGNAGTYIVWVKDAGGNGCVVGGEGAGTPVNEWRVKIESVDGLSFEASQDTYIACYGDTTGSIAISDVAGGLGGPITYMVAGHNYNGDMINTNSLVNLPASDENGYMVTGTDSLGCTYTYTDAIVIDQPEMLTATLKLSDGSFTCPDAVEGYIEANVEGGTPGYAYQLWMDDDATPFVDWQMDNTFLVPINHTYYVVVRDHAASGPLVKGHSLAKAANEMPVVGCDATTNSITINPIQPVAFTVKDVTCYGEEKASAEITATGEPGRTFSVYYRLNTVSAWTGPVALDANDETVVTDLTFANVTETENFYYFMVKDSKGCGEDSMKVSFVPVQHPLQISFTTSEDGLAADGLVSGGTAPYSIQMDEMEADTLESDSVHVVNLQAPASMLTIIDAHGCTLDTTIAVTPLTMMADPDMGDTMPQTFDVMLTFNRQVTVADGDITGGTVTPGTASEFVVSMSGEDGDTLALAIGDSIMDAAGNMFAGDTLTYIVGDNTAPMPVAYSPVSGTTLADNHPTLVITFDEDVVFNQAGNLYITKKDGTQPKLTIPVTASMVSGDSVTVTYTYDPEIGGLNKNTEYFVTADAGIIADVAGNTSEGLTDNTEWTFTTGGFTTGIEDQISGSLEFKVYPNPFDGQVTVKGADKLSKIIITNVAGQRVKVLVSPKNPIQLNDLHSGVYFMTLVTKDNVVAKTERIVKR